MCATWYRGVNEVLSFCQNQGFADGNWSRAIYQLLKQIHVEPVAVLDIISVAVLVTGAANDHSSLVLEKSLRPFRLDLHDRYGIGINDVVTDMAPCADDQGVE